MRGRDRFKTSMRLQVFMNWVSDSSHCAEATMVLSINISRLFRRTKVGEETSALPPYSLHRPMHAYISIKLSPSLTLLVCLSLPPKA